MCGLGIATGPPPCHPPSVSYLPQAKKVFDVEIIALRTVRDQLDEAFNQAVDVIVDTLRQRGKIVVAGIGKSGNIGRKIAATLTSTGSTSVVLDGVDALHGDLGVINDGDTILLLSYSGESEELLSLIGGLKCYAVRIIAVTGNVRSTLARSSELVLKIKVTQEACPFNLAPTASSTAMLAMGDALAMCVLQARGFKQQDFARHHPSGAIGRALLLKVEDIMRHGPRHAMATRTTSVKEALLGMTRAKSGSVSVVNARGRLVGVFTDGDLRRFMARDENVLSWPLHRIMTRHPVTIRQDALAVEALNLFNAKKVDDLIVVNAQREPVGLVDSQDLPGLKLCVS